MAHEQRGTPAQGTLGIICGGGVLPFAVADTVMKRGRPVMLMTIRGVADPDRAKNYPHEWVSIGQLGRFRRVARQHNCRDLLWIGALSRPSLWKIRFDWESLMHLPTVIASYRGGDDHLLSSLGRIFEQFGFRLLGIHDVAPDLLVPEGVLTPRSPTDRDRADIAVGLRLLAAIGPYDVGQATVVANNHVLAIEGIEGTDEMLARLASLRERHRLSAPRGTGVLVKTAKPGQDRRFDLPTIGPKTVEAVAAAGFAGIAVQAGETIGAELEKLLAVAERLNIFVTAVRADH